MALNMITVRDELMAELGKISDGKFDATKNLIVSVALKDKSSKLTFESLNLFTNLNHRFLLNCTAALQDLLERQLSEFDIGYIPGSEEASCAELSEIEKLDEIAKELSNHARQAVFSHTDDRLKRLSFYCVCLSLQNPDKKILFVRSFSRKKEFFRKGVFRLAFREGQYNAVTDKQLLFDDLFDCVIWDNKVAIMNRYNFTQMFGYSQSDEIKLKACIAKIQHLINLKNADEFERFCSNNLNAMSKAIHLTENQRFGTLTFDCLKEQITKHNIDIAIWQDNKGKEGFEFDSHPMRAWNILSLLDDSHLSSEMTNQKYRVNSKLPTA